MPFSNSFVVFQSHFTLLNDGASSFKLTLSLFSVIIFCSLNFFFQMPPPFMKRVSSLATPQCLPCMKYSLSNDKMVQNYIFRYIPRNIIESFAIDSNLDIIYFVDGKNSSLKRFTIRSNQLNTLISISASTGNNYICSLHVNKNFFKVAQLNNISCNWCIKYIF